MTSDNINGFGMRSRLNAGDWSAAVLVSGVVTLALTLFPYPMPHPCLWPDLTTAAGIGAPTAEFPALGFFFARIIFGVFGAEAGYAAMQVIGHLLAGFTAGLWFFVFRQLLEFGSRLDMADHLWNRKIAPSLAAAGALLVAFSEPVWTSSQMLSSAGVDLCLAAFAFATLFRFFARGRRHLGFLAFFFFGVLAAETPFGPMLLVPVAAMLIYAWRLLDPREDIEPVMRIPPIEEFPWILMVSAWIVGAGIVLAIADSSFRAAGGQVESFAAAIAAWKGLLAAGTTAKGAALAGLWVALPFVAAISFFPRLTFPEAPKPFWMRLVVVAAGVVACAQLVPHDAYHFRILSGEEEAVATTIVPGLVNALAAATFVLAAGAVAAMTWCHDSRWYFFILLLGRFAFVLTVMGLVGWAGHSRQCEEICAKLKKVDAHIVKTLDACKGKDVIPSQGRLDDMLKLRARCLGRKLTIKPAPVPAPAK